MTSRGPFQPRLFYDSLIPSGLFYSRHREVRFTLVLCQMNSKALQLPWKCLFAWYNLPHISVPVRERADWHVCWQGAWSPQQGTVRWVRSQDGWMYSQELQRCECFQEWSEDGWVRIWIPILQQMLCKWTTELVLSRSLECYLNFLYLGIKYDELRVCNSQCVHLHGCCICFWRVSQDEIIFLFE